MSHEGRASPETQWTKNMPPSIRMASTKRTRKSAKTSQVKYDNDWTEAFGGERERARVHGEMPPRSSCQATVPSLPYCHPIGDDSALHVLVPLLTAVKRIQERLRRAIQESSAGVASRADGGLDNALVDHGDFPDEPVLVSVETVSAESMSKVIARVRSSRGPSSRETRRSIFSIPVRVGHDAGGDGYGTATVTKDLFFSAWRDATSKEIEFYRRVNSNVVSIGEYLVPPLRNSEPLGDDVAFSKSPKELAEATVPVLNDICQAYGLSMKGSRLAKLARVKVFIGKQDPRFLLHHTAGRGPVSFFCNAFYAFLYFKISLAKYKTRGRSFLSTALANAPALVFSARVPRRAEIAVAPRPGAVRETATDIQSLFTKLAVLHNENEEYQIDANETAIRAFGVRVRKAKAQSRPGPSSPEIMTRSSVKTWIQAASLRQVFDAETDEEDEEGEVNITDDPASAVKGSPDAALTGQGMKRKAEPDEPDESAYVEPSRASNVHVFTLTCQLCMKLNGYGPMSPSEGEPGVREGAYWRSRQFKSEKSHDLGVKKGHDLTESANDGKEALEVVYEPALEGVKGVG
ncbi:hypothetical protein DFH11DRAFT_1749587 [Phellopilus nigrolimitatus]|nr:hypothetical protein DFH11DRAFT_1749587 [Phellopilus nigrolimitatus]